jgi:hypothetical protein
MSGYSFKGAVAVLLLATAAAGSAETYTPDVAEFDGSNSMTFEPAPQLELADGGTIEFWVVPEWSSDPGYDPVVICNAGPEGASYLIALLRDRDGIAIAAGDEEDVATFDFTDGRLHHVAISQFEDGTAIFVDGQVVGTSDLRFDARPSAGVWVGSIDGENNQFRGAIAGMRIWNVVVEQETLVDFAMKDIFADEHPDLPFLSAISDFSNGEILLAELELPEAAE